MSGTGDSGATGSGFNVYVPNGQSYLRLGAPDAVSEDALAAGTDLVNTPGSAQGKAAWPAGGLLYSTGPIHIVSTTAQVTQTAPVITSLTGDKLSGVHNGDDLLQASYVTANGIGAGTGSSTTSFVHGDAFSNTLGTTQAFTFGRSFAYVGGLAATLGAGSAITARSGINNTMLAGQNVTFTQNGCELSGYLAYKSVKTQSLVAGNSIRLSVNPANNAFTTNGEKLLTYTGRALAVMTSALAVTSVGWSGEMLHDGKVYNDDADEGVKRIKSDLTAMRNTLLGMSTVADVLQAAAIVYGLVVRGKTLGDPVLDLLMPVIKMTPDSLVIKHGASRIVLGPTGR